MKLWARVNYVNYDEFEKFKYELLDCKDFPLPYVFTLEYTYEEFKKYLENLEKNYPKINDKLWDFRFKFKIAEYEKRQELKKNQLLEFVDSHPRFKSIVNYEYI